MSFEAHVSPLKNTARVYIRHLCCLFVPSMTDQYQTHQKTLCEREVYFRTNGLLQMTAAVSSRNRRKKTRLA